MQASVMKHFITYLLCLYLSTEVSGDKESSFLFNETAVYGSHIKFPDDDGVIHLIDLHELPDSRLLFNNVNEFTNKYFLYTRQSDWDPEILKMHDASSITKSNFDPTNPTVVIVHGWTGYLNSPVNEALRTAFLSHGAYNVIVVDWSRTASKGYVTAVRGVPRVGQFLGQFLSFLSSVGGVSLKSMHLIGHSLGAHVVGNAGRTLGGQVGRVTGLDPAGPLWTLNSKRLRESDAVYVEAIHTNGGVFGTLSSVATADFYPNGGMVQPGCLTNVCNHKRSWELFAASVKYNHLEGHKCSSILQFTVDKCLGRALKMGNGDSNKKGSGVFRLKTKGVYPF